MYKLYKLAVEYHLVVAAESLEDAEQNASTTMMLNANYVLTDDDHLRHAAAEEIRDSGDLPAGWDVNCLPYTKYTHYNIPEELGVKTIKELL